MVNEESVLYAVGSDQCKTLPGLEYYVQM